MGDKTGIEWTEATWNPVTGCDEVSPGCDHCYAKSLAERFRGTPGHYYEHGFDVVLRPDKLDQPLRWTRGRRIFVNSMSDLFHKDIPDAYIAQVFAVMALAPQHTFQLLTKRHSRMRSLLRSVAFRVLVWEAISARRPEITRQTPSVIAMDWPLRNVWLGVSVEDQKRADLRIPALLATPAAVRFLSCEPLLGPVDLGFAHRVNYCTCAGTARGYPQHENGCGWEPANEGIDWVIVGGESGRGARPMHPDWARSLRDQCEDAHVPFLFKQWGNWAPGEPPWGAVGHSWADGVEVWRWGKKDAGRELDGVTHDGYPSEVA